jgi:hypothetical protein
VTTARCLPHGRLRRETALTSERLQFCLPLDARVCGSVPQDLQTRERSQLAPIRSPRVGTWGPLKPSRLVLVLALLAALVSSSARAGTPPSYQPPYRIDYRPQDQARARAAVLRRSDLPSGPRWGNGVRRPSKLELQPPGCSGSPSTASKLVLTGAISSQSESNAPFGYGHYIEDRVRVFAAKGMVDRDTRSLRSPSRVLLCMRKLVLLKPSSPCTDCEITSAERIVSLGALPLPGLSSVVFASKALIRMKAVRRTAGRTRVLSRFLNTSYYVVIASGRTENVIIAFGRPREVTQALVMRLARVLAARAAA